MTLVGRPGRPEVASDINIRRSSNESLAPQPRNVPILDLTRQNDRGTNLVVSEWPPLRKPHRYKGAYRFW